MSNYIDNNPWAGLSSYEDPEKAKREGRKPKLFCGRDDESHQVMQLISSNIFVTLYGKSGTGKTSLLNAGVFPRLRQKRYLPVSIRLSMDALDTTFQQCIVSSLSQSITEHQGQLQTVEVVPMPADEQSPGYLWSYFARTRFVNGEGCTLFPVIVLDQFEEIFRNRRLEAEALLRQVAYLMDESHALTSRIVDGKPYKYDFNFRFVASIREDDLYRLEDSIDNNYLSELKRCRYRLRSLSDEGARDVILVPGEGLFKVEEQDSIVDAIIGKSRNEDGSISTNIVSLLCNRIFVDFQKSSIDHITPSLVDNFIKGNPFERFYNEATKGLSNKEKSYIEDNLVDSTSRRNSIPESDFLLHVPDGASLLTGNTRILQRTSTYSDVGNYRIELIHDSFCEPLAGQKEKREKRKRIKQFSTILLISFMIIGIAVYVIHSMSEREKKMLINQSRFVAEKALALIDDGDSYLARLLLLEVLPRNVEKPNRPLVAEAEYAFYCANSYNSMVIGSNSTMFSISYSPDGSRIVSTGESIIVWDAYSGAQLGCLKGHDGTVMSAAFSPDGKRIVSSSWDGTIRIWDMDAMRQIGAPIIVTTGGYVVGSVSYSPNGKFIVSGSGDGFIRVWDVCSKKLFNSWKGHDDGVNSANYSPNGQYIVSASNDGTVKMWEAKTGQQIGKTMEVRSNVKSASFSPDGKYIVSAGRDIRIWQTDSCKQVGEPLDKHKAIVESVSFSADGQYILSASWDNSVILWDAVTRLPVFLPLEGHTESVYDACFSPDGNSIASTSVDGTIRIWDISDKMNNVSSFMGHEKGVLSVSYSPNGKYIVSSSYDCTARIWNVTSKKQIGQPLKHDYIVYSASFDPDGKQIVTASGSSIYIWDAISGKKILGPLKGHKDAISSVTFSPNGKLIVSASYDQTIRLWNATTGQQICNPLIGHKNRVLSASFSSDGKYIVSCGNGHDEIRIWDVNSRKQIRQLFGGHKHSVRSVSFSSDGQRILSAGDDNSIRIWNAKTGQQIDSILGGRKIQIDEAWFSPDNRYIVSSSYLGKAVCVWDSEKGVQICKPVEESSYVSFASFSPNGKSIIYALDNGDIKTFDIPSLQDLIDKTRECFKNRPLTPDERRKYYLD